MKGLNKTLNGIKASEALEQRLVFEEVVLWDTRYKGERPYIPYYFAKFSKKEACDTFEDHIRFVVTENDKVMFPELKKRKTVKLSVSQSGKILEV